MTFECRRPDDPDPNAPLLGQLPFAILLLSAAGQEISIAR
jgi:hypothetical protein